MVTESDTRDEFAHDDAEFDRAHNIILQDLAAPLDAELVDGAASALARTAIQSGDRLKLAFLLARFEDYVNEARAVPAPILRAIAAAFRKFRGGVSMDDAFALKQGHRGRKATWATREWARTNAALVSHYVAKGETLEVAVERASAFRKQSESQVKRDYLHYRRRIK